MRIIRFACAAALALPFGAFAQQPPAPIWPADGKIPESLKDHYVFLTPDLGTVVIAFPPESEGGERKILRLTIHNRIRATVSVDMNSAGGLFRYNYLLFNSKASRDGITMFDIVVAPDLNLRDGAAKWLGGLSPHSDAKRVGLSGAPNGLWVSWTPPLKDPGDPTSTWVPLEPGSSTRFIIESANRPGFTTATVEQFPPFAISGDWPEQVVLQASPLEDLDGVEKHITTLGPRYAPEDPAGKIATDYLSGMADVIKDGRLDPKSPYILQTTEYLRSIVAGRPATAVRSAPGSRLEGEIEQALRLCFGAPPGKRG